MLFKHFFNSQLSINSYLVGDSALKCCAVIDPPRDISEIANYIKESKLKLLYILETHVHADFISGAKELKQKFKGAKICCSGLGTAKRIPAYCDHAVDDGERITLGSIHLQAFHTPGHTPEHIIWLCFDESRSLTVPWFAFTGDFLFVGSIGRPDLLGEKEFSSLASSLYESLFEKSAHLPDSLEIFPAHGAGSFCGKSISYRTSSTLGFERLFNPGFKKLLPKEWNEALREEMPAAPLGYAQIKEMNLKGPKLMEELFTMTKPLSEQELAKGHQTGHLFIDVRSPELFAANHLKNAINIPMMGPFPSWAEMILTPETSFYLILPNQNVLEKLKTELALVGLENLNGFILFEEVEKFLQMQIETIPLLTPEQVAQNSKNFTVIDVRTPAEWHQGHIHGAVHLELPLLEASLGQLPPSSSLATVCGGGFRASIAASMLRRAGFKDVANIRGGMGAWREARLPTTTQ